MSDNQKKKYLSKTPQKTFSKSVGLNTDEHSSHGQHAHVEPSFQHSKEEPSKSMRIPRIKLSSAEKHSLLDKSERVKAALVWLNDTFPDLFRECDCLPMKIGTTHDISDWIDARKESHAIHIEGIAENKKPTGIPSKTAIRDAIRKYTNTPQYQKSLQENEKRYDLNGIEFGIVEEQQKEHAGERNKINEAGTRVQAVKHQALKERRKRIAANWHKEKQIKKKTKEVARESAD